MPNDSNSPLIFPCPSNYWALACDGNYPSVMDCLMHPESVQSFLFAVRNPEPSDEVATEPWMTISAEILIRDETHALVLCREQDNLSDRSRVGIVRLDMPDTTLRWVDEGLPIPEPWLSRLEAANLVPPPRYRTGSRIQREVQSDVKTQIVLQFIQSQELDVLRYIDCGEEIDEDAIAVPFERIAAHLELDNSAALARLTYLEEHNLLVSQYEIGMLTEDGEMEWSAVPSGLAYLSVPFYQAISPDLQTQISALDSTPAGKRKRQQGIKQLEAALQSYPQ
ncbi:hypothetical protein NC981_01060 [Leptolyngbya sp. DQ-M1]|uniref:hypothetical protein n=1 Tax=Leptolyngbya sp. DQ-M1 TaxID=2933920 RepID=UPI00329892AE